jgi:glycosyltransferase involved in cell wall biosynthesis
MIGRLISDKSLKVINETVSAPGLYHLGDVYVYPSRLDGIGLTIAEALSCGLPAIVTDQQPMNEFVEDYVSGRLVKIEKEQFRSDNYFWPQSIVEVEDLASKMEFYVKKKHDLPFLKQKSRDYACQYLDWKKNSQYLSENLGKLKFIDDVKKRDGIKYAIEYQKRESFLSWVKRTRGYAIVRKNLKYFFE